MKLRNKKTGEVIDCKEILILREDSDGIWQVGQGNSLDQLNEDWEDYKPAEPLIKDEKVRKVFREWADLYGAKQFRVSHHDNFGEGETTSILSMDIPTEPGIELPGHIGKDSETYTITELCGEEGE